MNKYLAVYGKPRYLGIIQHNEKIESEAEVIIESHRGEEIAVIAGELTPEQEASYRLLRHISENGDTNTKNTEPVVTDLTFIGFAAPEDVAASFDYRREEDNVLKSAKELLKPHDIDMKLIDVEYLLKKRKLFFYFSSDQRVDFRAYVRDLAREFKTRIELRQIGVRDEAKVIRGVGPCGRPCCCSYWLNQFAPIGIKMVKEQNLALNPSKISGICGRLMCCMCFEYNVYHEMWSKLPAPGTKIKIPTGNAIVLGIELHTKNVRCFVSEKGEVKVPIEKFEEFKEAVIAGRDWGNSEQKTENHQPSSHDKVSGEGRCADEKTEHKRNHFLPKKTEKAKEPAEGNSDTNSDEKNIRRKKRKQPKSLPEKIPQDVLHETEGLLSSKIDELSLIDVRKELPRKAKVYSKQRGTKRHIEPKKHVAK